MIEFPLPFREEEPIFTCNQNYARNRTKKMAEQLKKDPERLACTLDKFAKNFDPKDPVFEPVPLRYKGRANHQGRAYWIPLFTVWKPLLQKSRIVFDSKARMSEDRSLNEELIPGPDRNNSLRGVLLRFRKHPYAVTADVENMFHHIALPEDQSTYMRFFWFRNNDPDEELIEYWSKVHLMGNTSSPAVANLAVRYAAREQPPKNGDQWMEEDDLLDPHQLQRTRKPDEMERVLAHQIYVDDLLASCPTPEAAEDLIEEAIARFGRYRLKFCKVASNVPSIQERYPSTTKIPDIMSLAPLDTKGSDLYTGKSLGLQWDRRDDKFSIKVEHKVRKKTLRGCLGYMMEPYDPNGMAAPAMLFCKLMHRELNQLPGNDPHGCGKLGWDDELPKVFDKQWDRMVKTCQDIQKLTMDRSFYPKDHGTPKHQQLFAFADASDAALCYVVYLRTITTDGSVWVSFVRGQTKVLQKGTSVKGQISIPRAELCAADALVQEVFKIEREIDIPELLPTQYYTDSRDVLGWITNTKDQFQRYVVSRRDRICKFSEPDQWHYIATKENPADIGTRIITVAELMTSAC